MRPIITTTSTVESRARTMWTMRLHSAIRTSLACAIVGGATLYGPEPFVETIRFSSFSYLTVVLIAFDATLGDTLRGCWHAFCATVQVVPIAILGRWIIGPVAYNGLSISVAGLTVVVASFLVIIPELTHVTAKRIALGQIILVCTDAVFSIDGSYYGYMHPIHLAASTGLGALASLLALLIPFPLLAYFQVRKLCRLYAENAMERMNLYFEAFRAKDANVKADLIRQAKPLAETGTKLLQSIRVLEEGMIWETPWRWRTYFNKKTMPSPAQKLQPIELAMKGIEYSLVSSSSVYPVQVVDQEHVSSFLQGISCQIQGKLEESICLTPFDMMTAPDTSRGSEVKLTLPIDTNSSSATAHKFRWVFFFLTCFDVLLNVSDSTNPLSAPKELQQEHEASRFSIKTSLKNWFRNLGSSKKLESAFKCSISLGLAVFFGLIYDRENACWGGLAIAISFGTGQQPIFTISNKRALGTAIGSVYGVICCLIAHRLRPVALLPWIIITSFLRHSRMYGQPGGISAAIGALLILGRKLDGSPHEFAIERLTVVYIGLACFIVVEFCMQPKRAAALARSRMYLTLCAVHECVKQMRVESHESLKILDLRKKLKKLESLARELEDFVANAETEPEFWYLPFQASCYERVLRCLYNAANLLHFIVNNLETTSDMQENGAVLGELQKQMDGELEILDENLSSLVKCVDKSDQVQSRVGIERDQDDKFIDLEAGKLQNPEKVTDSLMTEAECTHEEEASEDGKETRDRVTRYLNATVFCVDSLRKELDEIEMHVKEIVRWENHKTYLN